MRGLLLLVALPAALCSDAFISASSPLVSWTGRPFVEADGSVSLDWVHTSASFQVLGKGATVTLHTNVSLPPSEAVKITVFVNSFSSGSVMIHAQTPAYLLTAGLTFDVNNITVHYDTECLVGGVSRRQQQVANFVGFSAGNGGTFAPATPLLRRMDVVGDSITAGSMSDLHEAVGGALSLNTGCRPWTPVQSYSESTNWQSHLARFFQTNTTTVAWSGKGLIHNGGCSAGPLMPQLYAQTFGTSPPGEELWDFSTTSRPDLFIIYLGTKCVWLAERTTTSSCARAFASSLTFRPHPRSAVITLAPTPRTRLLPRAW